MIADCTVGVVKKATVFLLFWMAVSCTGAGTQNSMSGQKGAAGDDQAVYRNMYGLFTKSGRFSELVDFATPVFYRYKDDSLSVIAADACAYIAQAYVYMDKYDSIAYYLECVDRYRALKANDISWNYIVNNTSALWSIKMKGDYDNALAFYLKSLYDVDSAGENRTKIVVLSNIVSLYRSLKNPDGLPYAEMAYRIGGTIGDDYYLASGAYSLASMLYLNGDMEGAMKYVSEAIDIAGDRDMDYVLAESYLVCGDIYAAQFEYDKAEKYYGEAMKYALNGMNGMYVKSCLAYGRMYNVRKDTDKSLFWLKKGLEKSDATGERECYVQLLKAISVAYTYSGVKDSAAVYFDRYKRMENNERFLVGEQGFDRVLMQYYQEEIGRRNARLEKVRINNIILILVLVLILTVSVFIFLLYRNRNRTYSALLEQYNRLTAEAVENKSADIGSDKEKELYGKVEELMQKEKVYRSKDVSLAKISEILNTNRTYISRVINKYSGLSFYDYINRYRIREAIAMLSEPEVEVPLKVLYDDLGFNSNSVFYRAFVKETGVPPSYYKEEVKKKKKQLKSE